MTNQTERVHSHAGPSLLALAIVHTLLVVGSIVFGMLLKHGATVVNPYSVAEEARRFFADNPVAVRVSTFFLFGSSVPHYIALFGGFVASIALAVSGLGIYAATVISRLRFLGVRAAGSAAPGLCPVTLKLPAPRGPNRTAKNTPPNNTVITLTYQEASF